ncbi:hypothetical protein DM01DRAFT_1193380 [Hesseltinella vesiculosa]|uniref:Uncharacterized protein n=1 Tax=Hesseltinella vesiculosa TaxID=101127 RepID=A0A1X2GRV9_9FUNG|nr:hypothetical protein DM01DRAFT_1193380 [Hesseltinella vesiculosa]
MVRDPAFLNVVFLSAFISLKGKTTDHLFAPGKLRKKKKIITPPRHWQMVGSLLLYPSGRSARQFILIRQFIVPGAIFQGHGDKEPVVCAPPVGTTKIVNAKAFQIKSADSL